MADFISGFDGVVNSGLHTVFDNNFLAFIIKCSLAVYGGAIAPKLPTSWGVVMSNSWFRIAYMFMVLAVFNHEPTIAILMAVLYFVILDKSILSSIQHVARTGVVTKEVATLLSGGGGSLSYKSEAQMNAEAMGYQNQLSASQAQGTVQPHVHSIDPNTGKITTTFVPTATATSLGINTANAAPISAVGAPVTLIQSTSNAAPTLVPTVTTTAHPVNQNYNQHGKAQANGACGGGAPAAYTPNDILEFATV